jgi:rhomboid protease GluP
MWEIPSAVPMPSEPQLPAAPLTTRIPARSRGQVMDWSLVLASQGIEHVIQAPDETGWPRKPLNSEPRGPDSLRRWVLLVAESNHAAALTAIRLYRRDNRRWSWRKTISTNGAIFDGVSLAWVALTLVFFWLSATRAGFREAGILDGSAFASGEWWRLFTATLLHADVPHLATNALFGFILLGFAAGCYGTGLGLLAAFLAGVGGNLASWAVHGGSMHGLGASGVVMGALGLVAVHSLAHLRKPPGAVRIFIASLAGGVMLFTLLGLSPGTDVAAHLGGFLSGIAIGSMLALLPPFRYASVINLAAGLGFTVLVILTWALALGRIG